MFTAIIPTLQRSPLLTPLLDVLDRADLVAQVIVVNNAPQPLTVTSTKVEVVAPGENLFVNPSWNLGVQRATQPRLIIVNDDVVFPEPLLDVVAERLDRGAGIIGLDLSCLAVTPENVRPRFRPAYVRRYGFGSLMFLDRDSYVPIPHALKVWCGDDWLFRRQKRQNYTITGVPVTTQMGTTSTLPEFSALKADDLRTFRQQYADDPYARRHPLGYAAQRVTGILRGRMIDPIQRRQRRG